MQVGILTISDRSSRGDRPDASGPAIAEFLQARLEAEVAATAVVPDELPAIRDTLTDWADRLRLDLILTTGGTGFATRDVTPEATRAALERETPGIPEALRAASLRITPHAMLSRAVAGIRGRTLIVNLPGSPKAVRENLEVLIPILPHALAVLQDSPQAEAGHGGQPERRT
jgi:molybdenum cofactor synthesis domain-containing protein